MTPTHPSKPRSTSRRRKILWTGGGLLVVLLFVRWLFLGPAALGIAGWAVERFGGYHFEAESLDTNAWSYLEIHGLRLEARSPEAPLRACRASKIRAEFSLAGLLRRELGALDFVEAEDLRVEVDLTRGSDPPPDKEPFSLPSRLPALRISSFEGTVRLDARRRLALREGSLEIEPAGGEDTIRLLLPRWEILEGSAAAGASDLNGLAHYADGRLRVETLQIEDITITSDGHLDLSHLAEGRGTGRLSISSPYGNGWIAGELASGRVAIETDLRDIDLEALRRRLGVSTPLAGRGALAATFDVPLDAPRTGAGEASLDLEDAVLGATRWERVEGQLRWQEGVLAIPHWSLRQGENHIEGDLSGLSLTEPDLKVWLPATQGRLEAYLPAIPTFLKSTGVTLTGELFGPIPEHLFRSRGTLSQGVLTFSEGSLVVSGSGRLDLREARMEFLPRPSPEPPDIDLHLEAGADFSSLAPLGRIFGSTPWGGRLAGELQLSGRLPDLRGTARLVGRGVTVAGYRLGTVRLEAQAKDRGLELRRLELQERWGRLEVHGGLDFGGTSSGSTSSGSTSSGNTSSGGTSSGSTSSWNMLFKGLEFTLEGRDLAAFVADGPSPWPLAGSLHTRGTLSGPWRRASGELSATGSLHWGSRLSFDDLEVRAMARDGRISLERFQAHTPFGRILASAELSGLEAREVPTLRLKTFELEEQGQDLSLGQPVTIRLAHPFPLFQGLLLTGSAGTLAAAVVGEGPDSRISLRAESLDPMPFIEAFLPPQTWFNGIDLEASGRWQGDGWAFEGEGEFARIHLPSLGKILGLRWQGRLQNRSLEIDGLEISLEGQPILEAEGSLPFDPWTGNWLADGPLRLRGRLLPAPLEHLPVIFGDQGGYLNGTLRGNFEAGGRWRALEATADLSGEGVTLELAGVGGPPKQLGPGTVSARLDFDSQGLHLQHLRGELADDLHLELSGHLALPADLTALLGSEAKTRPPMAQAPLRLRGRMEAPNIEWARPWLPGIRRLGGSARFDLEAAGTLGQPNLGGTLELAGGFLRFEEGGLSVDALNARLALDSGVARIEELTGELGAAPFRGHGEILLGDAGPQLDLRFEGENLLLARDADVRLRADVEITVAGPLDHAQIEGRLGLRNARVRQEIDLLGLLAGEIGSTLTGGAPAESVSGLQFFSLPDPPLSEATFDLEVVTVDPIRLASNLASGSVRLDLRLRGTGEVPLPEGQIFLEPTQVRLPSGTVEMESGTLTFRRRAPFNPDLALRGNARLRGFDVSLQVLGSLEAPEILLSSSPPLPNEDLLLLVLTGRVPSSGGGTQRQQQAAETVALFLARDFLVRWLGNGDRDEASWVDRFEIVRGREVSQTGVETTDATFLVDDDVFGSEGAVYLVGEQDAFEDYNYGLRLVFRFQ